MSTTVEPPHCECGNAVYDERCNDETIDGSGCGACGLKECRTQVLTCPCPDAEWDPECADTGTDQHGGLGCNGCGVQQCRICGHSIYPDCLTGTTINPPTTLTQGTNTQSTTTGVVVDCPCIPDAKYDPRCGTSNDPHGGLGCNACGISKCRICGIDIYPACPVTTTTTTTTTSTTTTATTTTQSTTTTGM